MIGGGGGECGACVGKTLYWGYMGIMERKMEITIYEWVLGILMGSGFN